MDTTKIHLSEEEMDLLKNSHWILTKNAVIEKVILGMGRLLTQMQQEVEEKKYLLMQDIVDSSGKISRGEKYQGLPYVMLDYPRIFDRENILAIRTLFWWGNFYSVTLHLKGKYLALITPGILQSLPQLLSYNMFLSFGEDEWSHDVHSEHYKALASFDMQELVETIRQAPFLKLTGKVEFSQWEKTETDLFVFFRTLVSLGAG